MLQKLVTVLIAVLLINLTICACDSNTFTQKEIQEKLYNSTIDSIKIFINAYKIDKRGGRNYFCNELLYEFFNAFKDKYDCFNIGPRLINKMSVLNDDRRRVDERTFAETRAFIHNMIRRARLKLRDVFFKRDLVPVLNDMKKFINFIGLKYNYSG